MKKQIIKNKRILLVLGIYVFLLVTLIAEGKHKGHPDIHDQGKNSPRFYGGPGRPVHP